MIARRGCTVHGGSRGGQHCVTSEGAGRAARDAIAAIATVFPSGLRLLMSIRIRPSRCSVKRSGNKRTKPSDNKSSSSFASTVKVLCRSRCYMVVGC